MNILKNNHNIDDISYHKLQKILEFNKLQPLIDKKISKWRFFNLSYDKQTIEISVDKSIEFLSHMHFLFEYLNDEQKVLFLNLLKPKRINLHFKRRVLLHLHSDLILLLHLVKQTEEPILKKRLVDYFCFSANLSYKSDYLTRKLIVNNERSNIFTTNKNSVIYYLDNISTNQLIDKLKVSTINLISKNPLISFIEICDGFDEKKLVEFIKEINTICIKLFQHLNAPSTINKFSLKIRKIKRTRKKAMFIAEQNTIIIDPRHVDSFVHELGHWYHYQYLPDIKSIEDAENFAENFKNYLENLTTL